MNHYPPTKWVRVNRSCPCPVCGKPDYCTVAETGEVAKCTRVSDGAFKSIEDGAGIAYFHQLREPLAKLPPAPKPTPDIDADQLARRAVTQLTDEALQVEADALGVTGEALKQLRMGWSHQNKAFTFPLRDEHDRIIGIRLRNTEGKKWAVPGSKNGIVIPRPLAGKDPIFVVEGPTDCAALLSVGLDVLGRPSDTAGTDLLVSWITQQSYGHVVIALENNPACSTADINARRGAGELRYRLIEAKPELRVAVLLTPGAKDVRDWIRVGATKSDILSAAREAIRTQDGWTNKAPPGAGRPLVHSRAG